MIATPTISGNRSIAHLAHYMNATHSAERVVFVFAGKCCALGSLLLRAMRVTILFGGHTGGVLEVAIERCRIGKTELDGGFLQ